MSMFTPHLSFSQCSMTCNSPSIQISLGTNCLAIVTPDDILEGSNSCVGPLSVEIFDLSGNLIPTTNVSDNCDGNPTLSYSDNIDNPMCDLSVVQTITRTWTAIDESGNEAIPCVQTITLMRPTLGDIQFPLDRNDIEADALDCVNPDISPDNTGYPTLNGLELINGDICELWVMHTDAGPFAICDGSYSIIRTWTINEECTGNSITQTQEIKVLDSTGPVINCASDFTICKSRYGCQSSCRRLYLYLYSNG